MKNAHVVVAAILAFAAVPSQAEIVTFAAYTPTTTGANISYTPDVGSGSMLTNTLNNEFNFTLLGRPDPLLSRFTLSAVSATTSEKSSGISAQGGFSGFFQFNYSGTDDFTVDGNTYSTGATLLRADFTDAYLVGAGISGVIFASDEGELSPSSTLFLNSDVVSLSPSTERDFAFSLTSANPGVNKSGGALGAFQGTITGAASTDAVLPGLNGGVGGVPEASSWAMLILGFGSVGALIRSRKQKPTIAGAFAAAC